MYTTDFAYDGPIFLVPLSLSYPSSPVPVQARPAREGRSCEHFGGYKTLNRIPLLLATEYLAAILLKKVTMNKSHTANF